MLTRRALLRAGGAAGAAGLLRSSLASGVAHVLCEDLPPVRALTRGPGHYWFGYYDKLQFSEDDRYVLGMRVDFEHRTPRVDDRVVVGMVDTAEDNRWIELASSSAWGWQQGCMLQWLPRALNHVVWNDRDEGRFVTRVLDVESRELRTLPGPIYSITPDGRSAITADFARIQALRPGYGYVGVPDEHAAELVPEGSGVSRVDLAGGATELVFSIARMAALEPRTKDMHGAKHYVNHLLVAPGGERIVFLHRWRPDGGRAGFRTRMITATLDGEDAFVLDPSGHTSHFIWKDEEHLLAWTRPEGQPPGFYLFRDRTRELSAVGAGILTRNGHVTYVPRHPEWLLTDTYPDRERREQHPLLFHEPTGRVVPLGHFHSPPQYSGEWRCDTHPRSSRDGKQVVIDSPHGGHGRQMWAIDVRAILAV